MNSRSLAIVLTVTLVLNLGLTIFLFATRSTVTDSAASEPATSKGHDRDFKQALSALRRDHEELQRSLLGTPPPREEGAVEGDETFHSLTDRLASIERSLERLQSALNGISIESVSEERAKLFAAENGHLKADEYFAAEKYAVAGEGYLRFLEHHPEHPDHRNILERARNSFRKAGYLEKAMWAQEELMRLYPEHRARDLMALAGMEKANGSYAEAARHAAEATSLEQTGQRHWYGLFAAWYTELAQGPQAGLAYYRKIEQEIIAAGYQNDKLGRRARESIELLEKQIASQ